MICQAMGPKTLALHVLSKRDLGMGDGARGRSQDLRLGRVHHCYGPVRQHHLGDRVVT